MSDKKDFAEILTSTIQDRILKGVAKAEFVDVSYADRVKVSADMINEIYKKIDVEKIKTKIISLLEEQMAEKIVNKMITEVGNDIKQIMSNKELREDLRFYMRGKIKEIKTGLCESGEDNER